MLLQVAVVQISLFNNAFGTTPLSLRDWLFCTGLASIVTGVLFLPVALATGGPRECQAEQTQGYPPPE